MFFTSGKFLKRIASFKRKNGFRALTAFGDSVRRQWGLKTPFPRNTDLDEIDYVLSAQQFTPAVDRERG
ncbi:hypothetical protein CGZ80_03800 [Rhodopirellula sp. MGV]|nr:hypothetical protein CGZ80_03800 [Rhodopirellula sp. MGV]PNY34259.1 hypothetical protein C2E31_23765 [Rhodopirellula baltica]